MFLCWLVQFMLVPPSWDLQKRNFIRRCSCEQASALGQKLLFSIVASLRCSGDRSRMDNVEAVLFCTWQPGFRSLFSTALCWFDVCWKQAAWIFVFRSKPLGIEAAEGKKSWDLNAGVEGTGTRSASLPKGSFDGVPMYLAAWSQHMVKLFCWQHLT